MTSTEGKVDCISNLALIPPLCTITMVNGGM